MYFNLKKSPAPETPRFGVKLHLKLKNFFQPDGFFTEMLRFDKKFQRNFSEISLQLLKLLSIKKREILEKSRKNKIFPVLMGVTGMIKSRPASHLCLQYQCPTL
jgi:hypothetical protein